MDNRYKDFDAAWSETASAPLSVKVLGKNYKLPAKIPAKVVLAMARIQSADTSGNGEIPLDQVMELLNPFFGPGVLTEWSDKGIDVDQLGDVFKWAMSMYQGIDPDAPADPADPEAEDNDPNSKARPTAGQ